MPKATANGFVESLHDVFAPFGAIEVKRMFGGYGIYHEDLMFALVADDELYLKVDDVSRGQFEASGCTPFEYTKGAKTIRMSYYTAPEAVFDEPAEAKAWLVRGYEAALRARRPRRRRR